MSAVHPVPAGPIGGCLTPLLYAQFGIGEDEAGGEAGSAGPGAPFFPGPRAFARAGDVTGFAGHAITGDSVRQAQSRSRSNLSVCRASQNL